jgi:hypothetical protein
MAFAIFKTIAGFASAIWTFILQSFTHYDQVVGDVENIHSRFVQIRDAVKAEREAIKAFKFNPAWSTRVINVPAAFDAIQSLRGAVLDDFRSKLDVIIEPLHEFILIFKTEQIEQGSPQEAVSALSKAEVKLGQVVTLLHQVSDAMTQLSDFAQLFSDLRQNAEHLDALFLQQSNPRKVETIKIKRRLRDGS